MNDPKFLAIKKFFSSFFAGNKRALIFGYASQKNISSLSND